jgi:hypothetical protein
MTLILGATVFWLVHTLGPFGWPTVVIAALATATTLLKAATACVNALNALGAALRNAFVEGVRWRLLAEEWGFFHPFARPRKRRRGRPRETRQPD